MINNVFLTMVGPLTIVYSFIYGRVLERQTKGDSIPVIVFHWIIANLDVVPDIRRTNGGA